MYNFFLCNTIKEKLKYNAKVVPYTIVYISPYKGSMATDPDRPDSNAVPRYSAELDASFSASAPLIFLFARRLSRVFARWRGTRIVLD